MQRVFQHLDWENWLYGLWAAVVGGGSTAASGAIAVISVDPKDFNLTTTKFWQVAGVMFAVGAVTNFFSFLKQNPAPQRIVEEKTSILSKDGSIAATSKTVTTTTGTGDGK